MTAYDKTGVLGREEKRKWVRNQIRELRLEQPHEVVKVGDPRAPTLDRRFKSWEASLVIPSKEHLLSKEVLSGKAEELVLIAQKHIDEKTRPTDTLKQKVGEESVFPEVKQLIGDLAQVRHRGPL